MSGHERERLCPVATVRAALQSYRTRCEQAALAQADDDGAAKSKALLTLSAADDDGAADELAAGECDDMLPIAEAVDVELGRLIAEEAELASV